MWGIFDDGDTKSDDVSLLLLLPPSVLLALLLVVSGVFLLDDGGCGKFPVVIAATLLFNDEADTLKHNADAFLLLF